MGDRVPDPDLTEPFTPEELAAWKRLHPDPDAEDERPKAVWPPPEEQR